MSYSTSKNDHPDPLIYKADELAREQQALMNELRDARRPDYRQPLNMIRRFDREAKGQRGPFRSLGHFFKAVKELGTGGNWHQHPQMAPYIKALPAGMNETQGADGGYLVPPEFVQQLLMRTYENDLLSRCTLFPMSSNMLKIPAINETSRADGSRFGGVQGFWRSEAGSLTQTKPSIEQVTLTLDSLSVLVQATNELLEDASGVALETFIDLVATQEIAFKTGDAIINGDGVTKPLGIMNSPAKVTVPAVSGQGSGTIVAQNILNMWSRLHVSCRQNAVWLIDQSIEPALSTMTIGTAGANLVVYLPPGGLSSSPYATLMGRPVIPTEFGRQLGNEGDIVLVDLGTYLAGTRSGVQSASSMHVLFQTNEMMFRFILRLDGKPWWIKPLTPKSGGPTQSCILTLSSTRT